MTDIDKKPHRWSGWPGAYCLDCGAGQVLEIAIGENWYDPCGDAWISDDYKLLIELCDGYCCAKIPREDAEKISSQIRELEIKLGTSKRKAN